jgi:cytochrome b6-f complex iron-sulfur subunit
MDRKDFLIKTCAACGVIPALTFLDSCSKTNPVNFTLDLSNSANAALNTVGGSVIQNGVIVIKTSSGFEALSLTCTHAGCTVSFISISRGFACPCHGGTFDANGNVTGGPPPSNLTKYTVTQSGNILTIKG